MYGFEHNDVDPHNAIPVRTLKVLLRMNLPSLIPALQPRIENAFKQAIASGKLSGCRFLFNHLWEINSD